MIQFIEKSYRTVVTRIFGLYAPGPFNLFIFICNILRWYFDIFNKNALTVKINTFQFCARQSLTDWHAKYDEKNLLRVCLCEVLPK